MSILDSVREFGRNIDPTNPSGTVGGFFREADPTKVGKADTSGVQAQIAGQEKMQQGLQRDMRKYQFGREAPQMGMPQAIDRREVNNVYAPYARTPQQIESAQIGGYDTAQTQQAIEMARQQAMGQGPQVAQNILRQGLESQARQAMALAGAGGYNPAAVRQAQYQMAGAGQEAALEAAGIAAQQQLAGQQTFMGGAQAQAQMQQAQAMQQAELNQQANIYNSTQEGQMALANADAQLKANLANQGVDLEILKTNAARMDTASLANLEAQLKQMGADDAMVLGYLSSITGLEAGQLQAQLGMLQAEQARQQAIGQAKTGLAGGLLGGLGAIGAAYAGS